jgi:hypothetical protein
VVALCEDVVAGLDFRGRGRLGEVEDFVGRGVRGGGPPDVIGGDGCSGDGGVNGTDAP